MGKEESVPSFQGKLQQTLNVGEAGAILACSVSHDDSIVSSCTTNNKILLWDSDSGSCIASLDGHKSDVTRCSFGKELLATGSRDGVILLWRYGDAKRTSRITVHTSAITSCVISPNHQYLVTSSEDKNCRVWTIRSGNGEFIQGPNYKELFHDRENYTFTDASFSSDSAAMVTTSSDGQVKLWDTSTGDSLMDLCANEGKLTHARFSADGKYVITLTKEAVKVWNIAKKKVSWCIEDTKGFQAMCSHPKENMFIVVSMDGMIAGYHISNKTMLFKKSTTHRGPVLCCDFSASGKAVVTGGIDGKVLIWN